LKISFETDKFKYISDDSREAGGDVAFFCSKQNIKYLDSVKKKGAKVLYVDEFKRLLDIDSIKVIGVTGTNGKTTTSAAIYSLLLDLGERAAFQGTRGVFANDEKIADKSLTTPPLLETLYNIKRAKDLGCSYFVMEVSSHAINQGRIEGVDFALKVYTNLTQDHLDYHKTFSEYKRVKESFFGDESKKLINKDAKKIEFNLKNAYSYALDAPATFNILAFRLRDGIDALMRHFDKECTFSSPMYGLFNLYNITAAIASVKLLTDFPLEAICKEVENFAGVGGRMEVVSDDPLIIVDFAHTPDGMEKVLDSMKDRELVVVFGAGGDRDRDKRAKMGVVANRFAKKIYLTNDNPRSEEPMNIIEDIYKGISDKDKTKILPDRREAIKTAIEELESDEVLLVLGKGDEEYQIIADKMLPYDDREVIRELIKENFKA
jgi:UDP-N-acetylmuramoyl-L-alanyl-D-glutamate--2,6-diaminopimelate ligase